MARKTPKINAEPRDRTGTRYARRLRQAGKLPAVIYGHKEAVEHITLDGETIAEQLHHGAHLLEIQLDGKKSETCLIKDVQFNYLGDTVVHVDLARVDLSEEVTVWVPLEFKREDECSDLQEAGAYLDHGLTDVEVSCRADAIPESLEVDISGLTRNDSITVADIPMPPGVKPVTDPETTVASIGFVAEEEVEAAEEAVEAGAAEGPEVISEKTEEGDDEAGEAAGDDENKSAE